MVPTLRSRALAALRAAGDRGVCVADVERDLAYTLRNRVSELRSEGHRIVAVRCRAHRHRSTAARYVLAASPTAVESQRKPEPEADPAPGEQPQASLPLSDLSPPRTTHRDPTFPHMERAS